MVRSALPLLGALAALLAGCETAPDEGILQVTVVGAGDGAPLAGAIAAIEEGGLYVPNDDPSIGAPAYQFGAVAGETGAFTILLPPGPKGIHVFADGFYYASEQITIEPVDGEHQALAITAESMLPEDVPPTATNLTLTPSAVGPGGEFEIRADVAAGSETDPLSDEIIAVQPDTAMAAALNPPEAGEQGVGFPDGSWSQTLVAPDAPGVYTYYLVVSSEGCVTAPPLAFSLVVE